MLWYTYLKVCSFINHDQNLELSSFFDLDLKHIDIDTVMEVKIRSIKQFGSSSSARSAYDNTCITFEFFCCFESPAPAALSMKMNWVNDPLTFLCDDV